MLKGTAIRQLSHGLYKVHIPGTAVAIVDPFSVDVPPKLGYLLYFLLSTQFTQVDVQNSFMAIAHIVQRTILLRD